MTETRSGANAPADVDAVMALVVAVPVGRVDRLVVHQIDLARPSPGGIETCIRGLVRYAPEEFVLAIVGVDAGGQVPGRRLGQWEKHIVGGRTTWFLPVARLDPGNQARVVPHSLRLAAGLARLRSRLPDSGMVQAHRADVAAVVERLLRRPLAYFVHTQENGLTGGTSDSFWRRAASVHAAVERGLLRRAASVTVFNPDFAETARSINPRAMFSPTWYDPALVRFQDKATDPHRVLWVGRLEQPKDPSLALEAFRRLVAADRDSPWTLHVVGAGTLLPALRKELESWQPEVAARVTLRGRLTPVDVASEMSQAGVFLMTSHPGYEGFPRVLVEAMASGLPAVVTVGSDTGGLVEAGVTGYDVGGRDPEALAQAIRSAARLDRSAVRAGTEQYSAPAIVARIVGAVG